MARYWASASSLVTVFSGFPRAAGRARLFISTVDQGTPSTCGRRRVVDGTQWTATLGSNCDGGPESLARALSRPARGSRCRAGPTSRRWLPCRPTRHDRRSARSRPMWPEQVAADHAEDRAHEQHCQDGHGEGRFGRGSVFTGGEFMFRLERAADFPFVHVEQYGRRGEGEGADKKPEVGG